MKHVHFLLTALFLFFLGCSEEKNQPKIRPVRTIDVTPTDIVSRYSFNGIARSDIAAKLSFRVGGTVKKVYVRAGGKIKQGQTLITLDDTYFKLKVNEVRASLKQAEARLANAKSYYERIKQLYINRSSSLSELDNARTSKESAYASYKAMKNRYEQAKLQLRHTKLKAPIDGVVSEIMVHKGENVSAGVPVATISSTQNIEVPVSVPGTLIDNIRIGQNAIVKFDALQGKYEAKVVEVSTTSNLHTTTFPVVVRLVKKSKKIRPGMSATVEFEFKGTPGKNIYIVPLYALLEDAQGNYLFVVEEVQDGIGVIKRVNVKRGKLISDGVVILSGLYDHAKVLTAGMHKVQENQKVRMIQ